MIFPPWEWEYMYPYPRPHPSWHKSQASFDKPDFSVTPNFDQIEGYEAVLNPGEVLYNPPYWWHHVQSITPSSRIFRTFNCKNV